MDENEAPLIPPVTPVSVKKYAGDDSSAKRTKGKKWTAEVCPVAKAMDNQTNKLALLTENQCSLLSCDDLLEKPLLIVGAPGTGKTFVALEKLKKLEAEGTIDDAHPGMYIIYGDNVGLRCWLAVQLSASKFIQVHVVQDKHGEDALLRDLESGKLDRTYCVIDHLEQFSSHIIHRIIIEVEGRNKHHLRRDAKMLWVLLNPCRPDTYFRQKYGRIHTSLPDGQSFLDYEYRVLQGKWGGMIVRLRSEDIVTLNKRVRNTSILQYVLSMLENKNVFHGRPSPWIVEPSSTLVTKGSPASPLVLHLCDGDVLQKAARKIQESVVLHGMPAESVIFLHIDHPMGWKRISSFRYRDLDGFLVEEFHRTQQAGRPSFAPIPVPIMNCDRSMLDQVTDEDWHEAQKYFSLHKHPGEGSSEYNPTVEAWEDKLRHPETDDDQHKDDYWKQGSVGRYIAFQVISGMVRRALIILRSTTFGEATRTAFLERLKEALATEAEDSTSASVEGLKVLIGQQTFLPAFYNPESAAGCEASEVIAAISCLDKMDIDSTDLHELVYLAASKARVRCTVLLSSENVSEDTLRRSLFMSDENVGFVRDHSIHDTSYGKTINQSHQQQKAETEGTTTLPDKCHTSSSSSCPKGGTIISSTATATSIDEAKEQYKGSLQQEYEVTRHMPSHHNFLRPTGSELKTPAQIRKSASMQQPAAEQQLPAPPFSEDGLLQESLFEILDNHCQYVVSSPEEHTGMRHIARMLDTKISPETTGNILHYFVSIRGSDDGELFGDLLALGVDPDAVELKNGWTPAHVCAANARIECLKKLHYCRADFTMRAFGGETPLDVAETWEGLSSKNIFPWTTTAPVCDRNIDASSGNDDLESEKIRQYRTRLEAVLKFLREERDVKVHQLRLDQLCEEGQIFAVKNILRRYADGSVLDHSEVRAAAEVAKRMEGLQEIAKELQFYLSKVPLICDKLEPISPHAPKDVQSYKVLKNLRDVLRSRDTLEFPKEFGQAFVENGSFFGQRNQWSALKWICQALSQFPTVTNRQHDDHLAQIAKQLDELRQPASKWSIIHDIVGNLGGDDEEVLGLFLSVGTDPDLQLPGIENTPLHLCVLNRRDACLRLLLDCRARINIRNKDGKTPIALAEELFAASQQGSRPLMGFIQWVWNLGTSLIDWGFWWLLPVEQSRADKTDPAFLRQKNEQAMKKIVQALSSAEAATIVRKPPSLVDLVRKKKWTAVLSLIRRTSRPTLPPVLPISEYFALIDGRDALDWAFALGQTEIALEIRHRRNKLLAKCLEGVVGPDIGGSSPVRLFSILTSTGYAWSRQQERNQQEALWVDFCLWLSTENMTILTKLLKMQEAHCLYDGGTITTVWRTKRTKSEANSSSVIIRCPGCAFRQDICARVSRRHSLSDSMASLGHVANAGQQLDSDWDSRSERSSKRRVGPHAQPRVDQRWKSDRKIETLSSVAIAWDACGRCSEISEEMGIWLLRGFSKSSTHVNSSGNHMLMLLDDSSSDASNDS